MKPLRAAIVTRRFWPLVGGPERMLANLAAALRPRGVEATIVTVRWRNAWPARPLFGDAPVVRLEPPPLGPWNTLRYMRALAGWLRRHGEDFDVVYVSQLQQEAYAALRAVRRRMPVLLRAERVGRRGDCLWQIEAPCGRRIKRECMAAAGVAAPNRAVQRELEAAGYPRDRIAYLPYGVALPPPRTPLAQAAARCALADAHPALQLVDRATLAVAIGAQRPDEGLDRLLTVWRTFAAHWPGAKLWLVGPTPDRRGVEEQIERRQLAGRATVVGAFDHLDDLFAAADLFVAPSPHGSPVALLEAMAAGLPVVAAATAANRSVLTDQEEGLLVPEGDAAALLAGIGRLSADRDLAARLAAVARSRVEAEFSLAAMADQHVTWFRQACNK